MFWYRQGPGEITRVQAPESITVVVAAGVLGDSAYRPFPIIMGSILIPETPMGFYPFEVSAES